MKQPKMFDDMTEQDENAMWFFYICAMEKQNYAKAMFTAKVFAVFTVIMLILLAISTGDASFVPAVAGM